MPITKVEMEVITITVTSTLRRPWRSPIEPKKRPPSGRIKKPEPKTAKDFSRPIAGSSLTKKLLAMIAASDP